MSVCESAPMISEADLGYDATLKFEFGRSRIGVGPL